MKSDIEIAQEAKLKPIGELASAIGIPEEDLEYYGRYKAKVSPALYQRLAKQPNGKLIYTTAITPTPAGEGKTCTSLGMTQALGKLGKRVMLCIREPSLGPVFGIKGGAAGGGYSQVLPMDDINLHFTGDFHAVSAAHNLLAALIDNHIYSGNALGIDPKRVLWRRVMDMNERQLRNVVTGLGSKGDGVVRESGFDITVASEIMAILCLSRDLMDLKERLGRILVAYTHDGRPVYARDLKGVGAMAVLMKDAVKPNLVQTLEGQPAFVHGGPFANIAHGNNTIIATQTALKLADYVVTEGGFGSDLGAEKFFDIVHGYTGLRPDVVILVATCRALKLHGGKALGEVNQPDLAALERGFANLDRHISNIRELFGLPLVVAINRFPSDTVEELELVRAHVAGKGVRVAVSEVVARGGEGGIEMAGLALAAMEEEENRFRPSYDWKQGVAAKLEQIARQVYGADGVVLSAKAQKDIAGFEAIGLGELPICVAKTQKSISDDPAAMGAPKGWNLTVREVRASAGAGFLVAICGEIMTMPGLPKVPSAEKIDIDEHGIITGLF